MSPFCSFVYLLFIILFYFICLAFHLLSSLHQPTLTLFHFDSRTQAKLPDADFDQSLRTLLLEIDFMEKAAAQRSVVLSCIRTLLNACGPRFLNLSAHRLALSDSGENL